MMCSIACNLCHMNRSVQPRPPCDLGLDTTEWEYVDPRPSLLIRLEPVYTSSGGCGDFCHSGDKLPGGNRHWE